MTESECYNLARMFISRSYTIFRKIDLTFRRFKFIFKKPKYKVGIFVKYNRRYKITEVKRDWSWCGFFYKVGKKYWLSEGLLDFYNTKKNREV